LDKLAALRGVAGQDGAMPGVYTCGLTSRTAQRLENATYEVE
jgi:hypothetical protein